MMAFEQHSRWRSWMRTLALDIRHAHESARSARSKGLRVSDWRHAAVRGSVAIAGARCISARSKDT
jgi:hypothetical protein